MMRHMRHLRQGMKNTRRKKMNLDFTATAALVVVLVLFFVIFKLSKKLDFTLLVIVALAAGVAIGFIFHGHTSCITPIGFKCISKPINYCGNYQQYYFT